MNMNHNVEIFPISNEANDVNLSLARQSRTSSALAVMSQELLLTLKLNWFGRKQSHLGFYLLGLVFVLNGFNTASAQISIPNSSFTDAQDFSTLANTGTSSVTPPGWAFFETGANANSTYTAGTGSGNAGDTYSFGPTSSTERAFGGLQSGSLVPNIGVCYTNNTGSAITGFMITFKGETWRVGALNRADGIQFQYNQNTTAINGAGTWTSFSGLDYFNPGQATGSGSEQHSAIISSAISGLNIAPGNTFCLRWVSFDATGSDDGIGVDDYSLTAITVQATAGVTIVQSGGSTNITEGGATDNYTVVLNSQPTANVSISIMTDAQSAVNPTSLTFTNINWASPQNVVITAIDDIIVEGPHTSTISHSATSSDPAYNGISITGIIASVTDNDMAPNPCPTLSSSVTNTSCGLNNGTINLTLTGGTGPFNFIWNNGAVIEDLSNLPSGFYSVTVTSTSCPLGVITSTTVGVSTNPNPSLSTQVMNASCASPNGSIDLTITGGVAPFSFIWSNGAATEDISGLSPGLYGVTVTAVGSGCQGVTTSATVMGSGNTNPTLSTAVMNAACNTASGSIDLTTAGGVSPFGFLWSNGATTEDISGLTAGTYTVTVTSIGSGCIGVSTSATVGLVPDVIPPVLVCPGPMNVSCFSAIPAPAPGSVMASDNCTNPLTVTLQSDIISNQTCANRLTLTRTYQAIDGAGNVGNCQQIITVNDQAAPVFNIPLPIDLSVSCELSVPGPPSVGATDNCGGVVNVIYNETIIPGNCPSRRTLVRTWTASDVCGNNSQVVQTVSVVDNTPPVFVNPPTNITVSCDAIPPAPTLTATDNCTGTTPPPTPVIWINEIHYDNTGADVGEFIEVAGTAGLNLANYSLVLYNGSDGLQYGTTALSGTIDNESNGFGAVSFSYPVNGIQNGAPDGIALVNTATNTVVYYLSYEGVFTALNGPAMGQSSVDINVFEAGIEPIGLSLQLTGTGNVYPNFTWNAPLAQSPGVLNNNQNMTAPPNPPGTGMITYTFNQTQAQGSCPNSGVITRTWTATDACGNTATLIRTVTVNDNTPPVFIQPLPVDVTVECNAIPAPPIVRAVDNCGPLSGMSSTQIWINEFHYDNTGNDVGEFIEVAGLSGTNLSGYSLVLYNGSDGLSYNTINLNGTIDNEFNGYGAVSFSYPSNGIQNGSPDAIALVQNGAVIQFLSYEGVVFALNGPANGLNSTNIIVSETGFEPIGQSLQLKGVGSSYSSFAWNAPSAESPGTLNQGQTLSPILIIATLAEVFLPSTQCPQAGILRRTWSVNDGCGNSAQYTQNITVRDNTPPVFAGNLPGDISIECDAPIPVAPVVTVTDNCDTNVPVSFTSVTTPGKCPQESIIKRTYTAMDDCGNIAMYMYQVTIRDTKPPVINVSGIADITINCEQAVPSAPIATATDACDNTPTIVFTESSTKSPYKQLCGFYNYTIKRSWVATDDCGNSTSRTQLIKVKDDMPPVWLSTPPAFITVQCDEDNDNNIDPIAIDGCDGNPSVLLNLEYVPIPGGCAKNYKVKYTWTAGDKCGNIIKFVQIITVLDTEVPIIVCPKDITINSSMPIAVNWVTPKAADHCEGPLVTKQIAGPPSGSLFSPNTTTTISYQAVDDCGNKSICSFIVTINGSGTATVLSVSGAISTPQGQSAKAETVELIGDVTQTDNTVFGLYAFDNLPYGADLKIIPKSNSNPLNGVNTLDLIHITNHILGKKALDSPYKMLAADVNQSLSISASDLVDIRKLILGLSDDFEKCDSYRFIPLEYLFKNVANPFLDKIPDGSEITSLSKPEKVDFTAIKMGDVNSSYNAENGSNEVRTGKIELHADAVSYEASLELLVPIYSKTELLGAQFTLEFDVNALEVLEIVPLTEGIDQTNFGMKFLKNGWISVSINKENGMNGALFAIRFKSKQAGDVQQSIRINSALTNAEAYLDLNSKSDIVLSFDSKDSEETHVEAFPNPFKTTLNFHITTTQKSEAVISLFTMNGIQVLRSVNMLESGEQMVNISRTTAMASGTYRYTITVDGQLFTGHVVIQD